MLQSGLIRNGVLLGAVCAACAGTAQGQALHNADYVLRVADDRLEAGSVGPDGFAVYGELVRSAEFGAEGIPNFTNDPGVNAELGVLLPGMSVGFDLVGSLLAWDSVDGFSTTAPETLTVRKSGINTLTPADDSVVPGIVFGQASLDDSAAFHHHVQFILNASGAPDGLWLLTWRFWTDASGVADSEDLYVVFAQGDGAAEIDDAVAWVETNLIGEVCVADLAEPFGTLNFFDLGAFLTLFNAQDSAADLAAPTGVWNFFDLGAFLEAFNSGCP